MFLETYDLFEGREGKVTTAIARLKEFEPPEGYYLGNSGGKDSCVIRKLAFMSGVKFETHHHLTTVDAPELIAFIKKHHKETIFHRPAMPLPQRMYEKKLPPSRQIRWCCAEYKEGGGNGRVVVTGVRRAESNKRSKRKVVESCLQEGRNRRYLNLIVDWTDEDVWVFIKKYNVPYCSLYDEGFKRLGCILCPMTTETNRRRESERWPKIAASWKRWMVRIYNDFKGEKMRSGKIRLENFNSAEEYFEWYVSGKQQEDPDQMVMFE